MRRRQFVALFGAAVAWPLAGRAQQPAMPVIGFLSARSPGESTLVVTAFRQGLKEAGYLEGQNVHTAFRWAEGQYDRLPALAAELVETQVTIIFAAGGTITGFAAKAATSTIPIVNIGSDPDRLGLVASLNRPGGNVTGISMMTWALTGKRLELLRELLPGSVVIGLLINPNSPGAEIESRETQAVAAAMGQQIRLLDVTSEADIRAIFASLSQQRISALVISGDAFFDSRRDLLVALAAQYAVPTIYSFAAPGGLISYAASVPDAYRQAGGYVGRILKGEKPAELPIIQPTKFELIVNKKTAKTLGLTVPQTLLTTADEVIE
ncbi:MAG TPA: ABC transporter substrate-binding protein [Xanthobacteraceae bacterium]|nr:ABC transporter substrate-binding protein [Xanthobacteraceae bacterium]